MKKRIEEMIGPALAAIQAQMGDGNNAIEIPRTFSGSISSLGATITQMGLIPALAIYTAEQSSDQGKHRRQICALIAQVTTRYHQKKEVASPRPGNADELFTLAVNLAEEQGLHSADFLALKAVLLDAAVALKLALRTFKRAAV